MGAYCSKKEDEKLQTSKLQTTSEADSSREDSPDFQLFRSKVLDETPLCDESELNRICTYCADMASRDPENPDWMLKMGYCLYAKGRHEEAEGYFRKAVERTQDVDAKTYYVLGTICIKSGRLEEARDHLIKSVKGESKFARSNQKLGEVYMALKQYQAALGPLQTACDLERRDAELKGSLGLCLLSLDRLPEAVTALQAAVALDPGLAKTHNNLANAYRKQGKLNESIKHYLLAIERTPRRHFPAAHLNLAAAYFDSGDTASALRHFEEAMHVGTHIHKVMVAKGYHLLFKHARIREAIEYYLCQKYEQGRELLAEIRAQDKKNLIVSYYLACCHWKLGEEERAKALFRLVVKQGKDRGNVEKHFVRQFAHRAEKMLSTLEGNYAEEDSEQVSVLEPSALLNESIYLSQAPSGHSSQQPSLALQSDDILRELREEGH